MLKSIRITLIVVLVALGATACGGGGSSSTTPAGTAKKGLIIDTGSAERPYIYISPEGNSYTYAADPATGKPSGLTVSTLKGEDIVISLNTTTGMVDHWVYNDHVVYFTNYRETSGLVDVAVIYPDGSTQYFLDIAYKPPASTASKLLLPNPSNPPLLPEKNASVMLAKAGNWPAFFNALGVTVGAAICASDTIIALGASAPLLAETATIIPITMPVALGVTGIAVVCAGQTGLAIMAMAPDTKVVSGSDANRDIVLSHTDIDLINETVGFSSSSLFTNSASCAKKILAKDITGLKACVFAGVDAVSVLGSSTLQRVSGSFQAAIALLKNKKKAKGVFCCNGPDQIKPGQAGTWQAIILGGPDSIEHAFDFNAPQGVTLSDFTISTKNPLSSNHTYTSVGQYMINVSAILQGTTITQSQNFPVRVYDSLNVNCCTASGTLLSDGSSFKTGTEIRLGLEVTGGKQPYLYEFDLDAAKKANIRGTGVLSVDVIYDKPGTYSTFVKVTDDDGMIAMSNVKLLTVKDASSTTDTYKDFTASMCPNTFHNGSLSSPEQLTNNAYSLQDNAFSRTALCSYTSLDGQQTPFLEINWRTVSASTSSTDTCSGKADPYWFEAWRQASSQSRWVSVRWTGFFTNKTAIENAVKQVLADAVANGVGVSCP